MLYMNRWHITSFALSDNLYPAAAMGVLFLNLPTAIMGIREELSRTPEASSFHIWSYLGSRFELDRYKDYLTHEQALFLYNNIDYLRFHVGKEKTFLTLLENIANPVNIEAKRFDIAQSQENRLDRRKGELILLRNDYDVSRPNTDTGFRESLEYGLNLSLDKGRDNESELSDDVKRITSAVENTHINFDPTGLVELTINQPPPERQMNMQYQRIVQWFSLVNRNKLITSHRIEIAGYGEVTLTAKEALLTFIYSVAAAKGTPLEVVPNVHIADTLTTVKPQSTDLDVYVTAKYRALNIPEYMLGYYESPKVIKTQKAFEVYVNDTVLNYYHMWAYSNAVHDANTRSGLKTILRLLYPGEVCNFEETGKDYLPVLEAMDIPYSVLSENDFNALALSLLKEVIGVDLDGNGITNKHQAMIDIMEMLVSYNIVFGEGVGLRARMPYDYPKIEPGNHTVHYDNRYRGNILPYGGDVGGRGHLGVKHQLPDFAWTTKAINERPKALAFGLAGTFTPHAAKSKNTLSINDLVINTEINE